MRQPNRIVQVGRIVLVFVTGAVALWLVRREIGTLTWADVAEALSTSNPWRIAAALACVAASYACLVAVEYFSFAYAGRRLRWRQAARGSVFANAVAALLGFGLVTGSAIRLQIYRPLGVEARQIGAAVLMFSLGSFLGGLVLLGLSLALRPGLWWNDTRVALAAVALLTPAAAWFVLHRNASETRPVLSIGERALALAVVIGDWFFTALGLYLLDGAAGAFRPFLTRFTIGSLLGQLVGSPGGLGPLEAAIIRGAAGEELHRAVAALIVFRVIFLLGPGAIALPFWLAATMKPGRSVRRS